MSKFAIILTLMFALFTGPLASAYQPTGSDFLPGMVITFASGSCPAGFLAADGTSYLRTAYPRLFAAIGAAHGFADGSHFNVPDYRGRFLRGTSGGSGNDPDSGSRSAMNTGGNTGNNIGSIQGDQFASHTHTQNAHSHFVAANQQVGSNSSTNLNSSSYVSFGTGTAGNGEAYNLNNASTVANVGLSNSVTATNQNSGGNETRSKNANVTFCIRY